MKTPRIANAIGQIDDDLVADAAKCKKKNKKHWLKWGLSLIHISEPTRP